MIRICSRLLALLASAYLLLPDLILAAGEKADMLVVVADSRRVSWSVSKFFVDVYNTDPFMFGVYCVILTAVLGGVSGSNNRFHHETYRNRPDFQKNRGTLIMKR